MLSREMIQRHYETGDYEKLLRDVADNGLPLPLPLRLRLSHGPVGAIALGLRRLSELTYGPTALSRDMLENLLARQRGDGAFVAAGDAADPLATAAAVAAIGQVLADAPLTASANTVDVRALHDARDRAIAALAAMQAPDGLFECGEDRDDHQRGMVAAFILSLLADDERFRAHVRLGELMSWFEERYDALDEHTRTLYRLARAVEPTPSRPLRRQPAAAA